VGLALVSVLCGLEAEECSCPYLAGLMISGKLHQRTRADVPQEIMFPAAQCPADPAPFVDLGRPTWIDHFLCKRLRSELRPAGVDQSMHHRSLEGTERLHGE
jgi:hypothetical protein